MVLVFGHRGASGYAPENTLPAFELGIRQGCDGFEFDVQLTKDGVAVVHHDWTVDRTTTGSGAIRDLSFDEIRAFDAGKWFSEEFSGTTVPRLEELFEMVPATMPLNVELKSRPHDQPGLEKAVASIMERYNRVENTIVSSFNHKCLKEIRALNPAFRLGILYEGVLLSPFSYVRRQSLDIYSLHPCHDYVSKELVEKAHARGIKVACWTVNTTERARELEAAGVDIVITNYPDRCLPEAPKAKTKKPKKAREK